MTNIRSSELFPTLVLTKSGSKGISQTVSTDTPKVKVKIQELIEKLKNEKLKLCFLFHNTFIISELFVNQLFLYIHQKITHENHLP
jgi:hypothetical protein